MKKFIHGYLVSIGPSIYTNRPDKTDIRIFRESEWGARHDTGLPYSYGVRYSTAMVIAAESFETIRSYAPLQQHVLQDILDFARSELSQDAKEVAA